jgi:hypothetical protein
MTLISQAEHDKLSLIIQGENGSNKPEYDKLSMTLISHLSFSLGKIDADNPNDFDKPNSASAWGISE